MDAYDLRILVKLYITKLGIVEKRFRNNFPGPDLVAGFFNRHKKILTSQRMLQNVKRSSAAVSAQILANCFEELRMSLSGICFCIIIKYNDTNLQYKCLFIYNI